MNKKNIPISVTIDHVVPRILEFQLSLFGFSYSVALDNIDQSLYRIIDTSTGMVINSFTNYNQCLHFAEENDLEVVFAPNLDNMDF